MDQVTSTGEKEGWQRHGWTRPSRPHLPEEAASSQSPKPRHAKDGRPYSHRAGCAAASDADLSQKKKPGGKKSAGRVGAGGGSEHGNKEASLDAHAAPGWRGYRRHLAAMDGHGGHTWVQCQPAQ